MDIVDTRLPCIIVLEGDPDQMGFAHGRLLAKEIHSLVRQMKHHVFRRPSPLIGLGIQIAVRLLSMAMARHIPPSLDRELKAVSKGSGVAYSDLLMMNTLDDALNILRGAIPSLPKLACSSFVIDSKRCRDGKMLHGRNLDYHFRGTPLEDRGAVAKLLAAESTLFVYRPLGGNAFLSVGWPGFVGVATAINQKSISLGNHTSYIKNTSPHGIPSACLYRKLLEEASTISDMDSLLHSTRRTIGNNLVVSSGNDGSAALFEITVDQVMRIPARAGILVATNHFQSKQLAQRQKPYLQPHSISRWKRLYALCNRYNIGVEDALAILGDTELPEESNQNPYARIANEGTAVSVLFKPGELKIWVSTTPSPPTSSGDFLPFDVQELLSLPPGLSSILPSPPLRGRGLG